MDLAIFKMSDTAFSPVSAVRKINGQPVRTFKKELIKTGRIVKEEDGLDFNVTSSTLKNWQTQFKKMSKAGVKIPLPFGHENDGNAEKNGGYVKDVFVEDDSLFMVCDLIGESAIAAASKSDVSLYSPAEYVSGSGDRFKQPITHVALVTNPVVPGLSGFIPIAAAHKKKGNSPMNLKKIQKGLGIKETLTEANAEDLILSHYKESATQAEQVAKENEKLKKELSAKPAPKDAPKDADPALVELSAENRENSINGLVESGRITPKVADDFRSIFIGDANKAIALSLTKQSPDPFKAVVAALKNNDPVILKGMTGPQVDRLQLSKGPDGTEKPATVADAERRRAEFDARNRRTA